MSSPLFNALGGGAVPAPMNQAMQMKQAFDKFRQSFSGNPKQAVMQMLQSGQISQQQLNQAQQMAQTLSWLMNVSS